MTIVMVTHEPDIAAFASRLVTFRDGRVMSDVPNKPDDALVRLAAYQEAQS
jgi:putative ABC transport system ATP-binding protein